MRFKCDMLAQVAVWKKATLCKVACHGLSSLSRQDKTVCVYLRTQNLVVLIIYLHVLLLSRVMLKLSEWSF